MALSDETKNLTVALDRMRGKTRDLQDSLQSLTEKGLDPLFSALTQALLPAQRAVARKPTGDIVNSTLSGFAQKELPSLLGSIFGLPERDSSPARSGRDSGISVVINNNAGAAVSAREVSGTNDRKYLEITIDQMVANSLLRGRQTSGVLRSLFGLVPDLAGR